MPDRYAHVDPYRHMEPNPFKTDAQIIDELRQQGRHVIMGLSDNPELNGRFVMSSLTPDANFHRLVDQFPQSFTMLAPYVKAAIQ